MICVLGARRQRFGFALRTPKTQCVFGDCSHRCHNRYASVSTDDLRGVPFLEPDRSRSTERSRLDCRDHSARQSRNASRCISHHAAVLLDAGQGHKVPLPWQDDGLRPNSISNNRMRKPLRVYLILRCTRYAASRKAVAQQLTEKTREYRGVKYTTKGAIRTRLRVHFEPRKRRGFPPKTCGCRGATCTIFRAPRRAP